MQTNVSAEINLVGSLETIFCPYTEKNSLIYAYECLCHHPYMVKKASQIIVNGFGCLGLQLKIFN